MDIPRTKNKRSRGRHLLWGLVAVGTAVALTTSLRTLRAAAPEVDRAAIWIESVKRGRLALEVQGNGTLVPEQVLWITSPNAGRIDQVLVLPGAAVKADTVIVKLSNPQIEMQALEAERTVIGTRAQLANLEASLTAQRLGQEAAIGSLHSDWAEAQRRAQADAELARGGFLSALERAYTQERAAGLEKRLALEGKRLEAHTRGERAQLAAQHSQAEQLATVARFRRREVEMLTVRAGMDGILQAVLVQPGQSLGSGATIAKVAVPGRLKAELRVAEDQAKDLQIGQAASIDTHNGIISGQVSRIDPAALGGSVTVDVKLDGALPAGARPDLSVDGTIELRRLDNVLYAGRPVSARAQTTLSLFKLEGSDWAVRAKVRLGHSSAKTVEILDGLVEHDRIVISDMSQWAHVDRIRLR